MNHTSLSPAIRPAIRPHYTPVPVYPVITFTDGHKYDQRDRRVVYDNAAARQVISAGYLHEGLTLASER